MNWYHAQREKKNRIRKLALFVLFIFLWFFGKWKKKTKSFCFLFDCFCVYAQNDYVSIHTCVVCTTRYNHVSKFLCLQKLMKNMCIEFLHQLIKQWKWKKSNVICLCLATWHFRTYWWTKFFESRFHKCHILI